MNPEEKDIVQMNPSKKRPNHSKIALILLSLLLIVAYIIIHFQGLQVSKLTAQNKELQTTRDAMLNDALNKTEWRPIEEAPAWLFDQIPEGMVCFKEVFDTYFPTNQQVCNGKGDLE